MPTITVDPETVELPASQEWEKAWSEFSSNIRAACFNFPYGSGTVVEIGGLNGIPAHASSAWTGLCQIIRPMTLEEWYNYAPNRPVYKYMYLVERIVR